jgi:quercetin dioxygenase-like cupin family protein
MTSEPVVVRVRNGETITAMQRREVIILAERRDLTITWSRYAPGERGPDLHVHREHTDAFYVLEGELTFALGPEPEVTRLGAGGFVAVPPNVAHSFANESGADARWLNIHAPDTGFAAYLRAARDGASASFDSFDPPADGGRPAAETLIVGAGEGERVRSGDAIGVVKAALPDLIVAEWALDGPFEEERGAAIHYELDGEGRVLEVRAAT